MKKTCLFLFLMLSYFWLFAGTVSQETAANIGIGLFTHLSGKMGNLANIEAYPRSESTVIDMYILRFEPLGFVLMSADDKAPPLLGYSVESSFPKGELPAHVKWYLQQYSISMAEIRIHPEWSTNPAWAACGRNDYSFLHNDRNVSPLLSTTWDQDWPYNSMCPADAAGPGGKVYAGCVATAMAQVMKKWNYPPSGNSSHSYTATGYGAQTANFGATTYYWSAMPNSINSENSYISTLLYHCGVSVDMIYGADGSGAYSSDVRNSLVNYFRYSAEAQYKTASSYSATAWATMIQGDLDLGRPVYYSGSNTESGHAFVLDGYQGTDYFHFNWGWSGSYNGYFYLNNLNPGSHSYNQNQAAVFYVRPISTEPLNPPTNVTAVSSANNIGISWQAPGGTQSGFTDSFETYPDFTLSFAPWTLFDVDLASTYGFSNYTFPNSGAPMAYIIFNPGATTPPLDAPAHSGSKMAACFAATIPPNNDWLMTPRLSGAAQLKFWARSFVADYGLERFKVGVSTNYNALPATFNIISGPNYISVPTTWTEYVYDLSAYASTPIYIGIRCVSDDAFIFFVDDVTVNNLTFAAQPYSPTLSEAVTESKPASEAIDAGRNNNSPHVLHSPSYTTRSLTGYKVWRLAQGQENNEAAWTLLTPTTITSLSYTDTGWNELVGGTYKWAVKAEYTGGILSIPTLSNAMTKPNPTLNMLSLVSGWNLVSLNVSPTNHSIESLISGIGADVMQIKGTEGVYIPGNPFSTLTSLVDGKAYYIRMSSPQTWIVYGNPISVSTPLALVDGWNMVAYLPQIPVPVATATQSISTWLRQIKGTDGVYIPGNPFSTLSSMAPNKGYWIQLTGAHNLVYPGDGKQEASLCVKSPHTPINILPTGMTLLASCEVAEAGDILLAQVGDELRGAESFIDVSGSCGVLIQIYTETAGEEIHFSILKPDGSELPILTTLISQPQGTIGIYPNFLVLEQKPEDGMPTLYTSLDACYPNPFNPSTTISFSLAEDNSHVSLDIFNIKGQRIVRLLSTPLPGGKHTVTWDGKDERNQSVASGIYFIRMNADGYSKTIKALLSK